MRNEYQNNLIAKQSPERQEFIRKQTSIYTKETDILYQDMFMAYDGMCYRCNADVIKIESERGNDGSKLVTGCPKCMRSYCD